MCHQFTGAKYDRPISKQDVAEVFGYYKSLSDSVPSLESFIEDVYKVITIANWPQPVVLVAIVDLFYRYHNGLKGQYPFVTMPFSALNLETQERLVSPIMEPFHSVFGMFALADMNLMLLREVFAGYGMQFTFYCDCGCITADLDQDLFSHPTYLKINEVRGFFEAQGGPIRHLAFNQPEWQHPALDMGDVEIESYQRMQRCLDSLTTLPGCEIPASVQKAMDYLPNLVAT